MGFASRRPRPYLSFVYGVPGRKGRGDGHGGIAWRDAGMSSPWIGHLGSDFLFNALCCGGLDLLWVEPSHLRLGHVLGERRERAAWRSGVFGFCRNGVDHLASPIQSFPPEGWHGESI